MNKPLMLPAAPEDTLAWARRVVTPALRAAVDSLPGSTRRVAGYHFGWWDADEQPTDHDAGKALRPALTLLTAQVVGGTPDAGVPAAVAVELVHNFSLLHDDVMDRDVSRRHRPTAWTVFGVSPAILTGDALLSLAFDILSTMPTGAPTVAGRLATAVQALIEGQARDLAFEGRMDVTPAESLDMLGMKTGALFACACAAGALSAGATEETADRYHRYGEHLGLAFQLTDDLIGIWGDPSVTGKPANADLIARKKSAPVVSALASGTPAGERLADLYREPRLTTRQLTEAATLVDQAGGRAWTQHQADVHLANALCELGPDNTELHALAQLAARRDR